VSDGNGEGGVNKVLLVVILLILVAGGVWWYAAHRNASSGAQINVTLPTSNPN